MAEVRDPDPSVTTKHSPVGVAQTVDHLVALLGERGITVFAVIDQAAEARRAGLELRDTVLVVFGNPATGTRVMDAAPLAALALPLKILVWDDAGRTAVSYEPTESLAARFGLDAGVVTPLAVIDRLTDAVTGTSS